MLKVHAAQSYSRTCCLQRIRSSRARPYDLAYCVFPPHSSPGRPDPAVACHVCQSAYASRAHVETYSRQLPGCGPHVELELLEERKKTLRSCVQHKDTHHLDCHIPSICLPPPVEHARKPTRSDWLQHRVIVFQSGHWCPVQGTGKRSSAPTFNGACGVARAGSTRPRRTDERRLMVVQLLNRHV